MNFVELRAFISKESKNSSSFIESGLKLQETIFNLSKEELLPITMQIGTIPEDIPHDSSEEKLYAKVTDIILAKALQELGLKSSVINERANCADVIAKSIFFDYSLVGDAKAFRLSRTAKNQKDFKVKSMVDWREGHDYSVLVCPYFQYPKSNSQIYGQALDGNVCLLGWEHILLFLKLGITETDNINLSKIWNISSKLGESVTIKDKDKNINFHEKGNEIICSDFKIDKVNFNNNLNESRDSIIARGYQEIEFWTTKIEEIKTYSKDQAIAELITAMKLNEKISSIKKFINSIKD